MKKIYNGEFVISVSITDSTEQKNWEYYHQKSKRFLWGLFKTKETKGFYNNFHWGDEFYDESYFGWENGNKKLYIKDKTVYSYPRVYVKFVNDDFIEKRFQTFEEANTYYREVYQSTIKIKINNEES